MSIRTVTIATIAALGIALPALADDDRDFDGGDYDAFSENYDSSGRFERADKDKDGMISRDEQKDYEFARYDRDRDGNLDETEAEDVNREYEDDDDRFGED